MSGLQVKGDTHNFGRSVMHKDESWIQKPRFLIWEHMFLDPRSEFRKVLSDFDIFDFLPSLNVELTTNFFDLGLMQKFVPKNPNLHVGILEQEQTLRRVGFFLAASYFFGLRDLHHSNVILDAIGDQLVICPVDIEVIPPYS